MNKKLIAIAIAAAVSAPAMAATSNVEVYGLMSVGVDSVTNGYTQPAVGTVAAYNTTNRVGRVSDYASRIGFKGSEDLGNGLKAIWQIEQGLAVNGGNASTDATSSAAFGGAGLRNTFVGLSSKDMGTVIFGRNDTPYKMSTARLDVFADTLGDMNGLVGAAGVSATTKAGGYFDIRANDVVAYITPNFSGFSAVGAYVFGNASATNQTGTSVTTGTANTADTNANAYSLNAMYEAGPMYLTAAYEKHNLGAVGVGSLPFATDGERKAWKLGAQYSIMDFTLNALYEKTSDNLGQLNAAGAAALGQDQYGHGTWYLSGKYQMGAIALKAAYAKAGSTGYYHAANTVTGAAAGPGNDGAKQYTLGADYAFSKRTTVYALYTHVSNDANGNFTTDAGNAPIVNVIGQSVSGFSLGMKHAF